MDETPPLVPPRRPTNTFPPPEIAELFEEPDDEFDPLEHMEVAEPPPRPAPRVSGSKQYRVMSLMPVCGPLTYVCIYNFRSGSTAACTCSGSGSASTETALGSRGSASSSQTAGPRAHRSERAFDLQKGPIQKSCSRSETSRKHQASAELCPNGETVRHRASGTRREFEVHSERYTIVASSC